MISDLELNGYLNIFIQILLEMLVFDLFCNLYPHALHPLKKFIKLQYLPLKHNKVMHIPLWKGHIKDPFCFNPFWTTYFIIGNIIATHYFCGAFVDVLQHICLQDLVSSYSCRMHISTSTKLCHSKPATSRFISNTHSSGILMHKKLPASVW